MSAGATFRAGAWGRARGQRRAESASMLRGRGFEGPGGGLKRREPATEGVFRGIASPRLLLPLLASPRHFPLLSPSLSFLPIPLTSLTPSPRMLCSLSLSLLSLLCHRRRPTFCATVNPLSLFVSASPVLCLVPICVCIPFPHLLFMLAAIWSLALAATRL